MSDKLYECPHCGFGILNLAEVTVGDPPYDSVRVKPCNCMAGKEQLREQGMDVEAVLEEMDDD